MERKLKVGVVGVGSLGTHHARIYSRMPAVELVGVCDVDPQRAAEIAAQCQTRAFSRVEELATAIEAASVVVPTDQHHAIASLLLQHNVNLLVEKPIAASMEEAQDMVAQARARNLVLQVGHVERFNPVMRRLEELLDKPRFIEATRLGTFPAPGLSGRPRGTEVSVVLDLMIHDLEIILHLVRSEVREIHAIGVPVLSATEDIANVRLLFANGCVANVTASRISGERLRKIRVFQQDSYVSLDYMNQAGKIWRKTAAGIAPEDVPIEKGEPLAAELESFAGCVLRRDEPLVSGMHASNALRLATDICRQIRDTPS